MTQILEVSTEEYERIKTSEYVLVLGWVNKSDEWTRTWVDAIGTREECEEAIGERAGHLYVAPVGLSLQHEIVETSIIAPPGEQS